MCTTWGKEKNEKQLITMINCGKERETDGMMEDLTLSFMVLDV